jgi:O-antigen/teichoic acid export membrane protein
MMEMGVGAVVRASLYKPLAEHDEDAISRVLISSRRFFRKIGLLLCAYTAGLMFFFPLAVDHRNGYVATAVLVGAIAFSSLANYLFGIVYQQLLNADQRSYVQLGISAFTTMLNTVFGIILIQLNATIEMVKLFASIVVLLRPMLLKLYVDQHYKLNFHLELTEEPINQKWNGLAQHIAQYVMRHADTIVLTFFSTLENVSVYYVYHLVLNGLQQMIEVLLTGTSALLGSMYAKRDEEGEKLQTTFTVFEWIMHMFVTSLYTIAGIMIVPFVGLFTSGVSDASYSVPAFAAVIVFANGFYGIRLPYNAMILIAGHFKQTQRSYILQASMNVIISIVLVIPFGLLGVAIGTLVAMVYQTVYEAWYLRTHIMHRPFSIFVKHIFVDALTAVLAIMLTRRITFVNQTWLAWGVMALKVSIITLTITIISNIVFYWNFVKYSLPFFLNRSRRESY